MQNSGVLLLILYTLTYLTVFEATIQYYSMYLYNFIRKRVLYIYIITNIICYIFKYNLRSFQKLNEIYVTFVYSVMFISPIGIMFLII